MDMEKIMEDPGCVLLPSTLDVVGPSFTSVQPPRVLVSSLKRHLPGLEIIVQWYAVTPGILLVLYHCIMIQQSDPQIATVRMLH